MGLLRSGAMWICGAARQAGRTKGRSQLGRSHSWYDVSFDEVPISQPPAGVCRSTSGVTVSVGGIAEELGGVGKVAAAAIVGHRIRLSERVHEAGSSPSPAIRSLRLTGPHAGISSRGEPSPRPSLEQKRADLVRLGRGPTPRRPLPVPAGKPQVWRLSQQCPSSPGQSPQMCRRREVGTGHVPTPKPHID